MVNKCSVSGYLTNHATGEKGTVFELPTDPHLKSKWLFFLKRDDLLSQKHVFVCYKHFANHFVKKNNHRYRLISSMNPYPTILPQSQNVINVSEAEREQQNNKTPRKPPTVRQYQPDELIKFQESDTIRTLEDIDAACIKELGENFTSINKDDHLMIYKLETSNVPEVTYCIDVSSDLRVKLYHKNIPVPLPEWFRQGRNTFLTSKSMIVNFVSYLNERSKERNALLEEINSLAHQKHPTYSYNMILFALELRYTSVQAYKMLSKEMMPPSLTFLRNLTRGKYLCLMYIYNYASPSSG